MKKPRISFIAAGRMANAMAAELKQAKQAELVGVYDPLQDRSAEFLQRHALQKVYQSAEELIADKSLDGIVICNYGDQHCRSMLDCMAAGHKSIFCEKPAVRKLEEIDVLRQAAAKSGANIMIGHHRRHAPLNQRIKELLDEKRLGRLRFAKIHFCNAGYARQWGDYFASYARSGGTTLDMASHYADLLNWFFGRPKTVSARAVMFERSLSADEPPCDYVSATISYDKGFFCGLESSYQRYGQTYDRIEIYGDKHALVSDFNTLQLYNAEEKTELRIIDNQLTRLRQAQAFCNMILDGKHRQVTLDEGLEAARLALAMLESSESEGKLLRF